MPISLPALFRAIVAVWITLVLVRAGQTAWRNRDLVGALWRSIDARTVARAFGLLVLVLVVASLSLQVPGLDFGVGSLLDFEVNAVFTPLEQAAGMAGPPPVSGPDWTLAVLTTLFLGALACLIPWLAFIEEEVFRAGLEAEDGVGRVWSALRFGLAHLVMLVPVGATLAIAVAGWVYGRQYLRTYAADPVQPPPGPIGGGYRPGRRALAAHHQTAVALLDDPSRAATLRAVATRQAAGVAAAARLHAAFNLLIVGLVWLAIVSEALLR